ncbi:uncharacterized protein N7477_010207 [Penicillium maclennaniae]|uniref:uncharacterized protein n=1 Tax=Penicillium maclennaniae TaxID=1343394 RepID=UPI002540D8F8|nr:uncharacterized protein N7477_010207 [Penicillium maclennaniae]KAJ5662591.1 hypothetical protein N7477_010207 [Penicillium maclennaniae]
MMESLEAPPESLSQRTEPPSRESVSVQGSPLTGYETPGLATTNCSISKEDTYDTELPDNLPPVFEMYSQVLAHLYQPDANRINAVHQVEYLNQLNLMVREVESHRSLLEKMANLREEFSRVQTENMHLRAYLNSRMPSEGGFARPFIYPELPRPLADTTGKSWDSIATDFI